MTADPRLFQSVVAGGLAIAAAATALAFAAERPVDTLIDWIGLHGAIALVAASLLSYAARRFRVPSVPGHPGPLLIGKVAVQMSFVVAVVVLVAAWVLCLALGLRSAPTLLDAFLLALVASALFSIAGTAIVNLVLAVRAPRARTRR